MEKILNQVDQLVNSKASAEEVMLKVCQILDQEKNYYNWTGFYLKDGDKKELVVGPYVGAHTDHQRIPYGKGICGQVAESNEVFLSQDVSEESNYLSCSIATKAELVVPMFKNGENIGQIDIDSHYKGLFTNQDTELLKAICEKVATKL